MRTSGNSGAEATGRQHRAGNLPAAGIFFCGWVTCTALCACVEFSRLQQALNSPAGGFGWFTDWNAETTLPLIVLCGLPGLISVARRMRWSKAGSVAPGSALATRPSSAMAADRTAGDPPAGIYRGRQASPRTQLVSCLLLFLVSFGCSASIGLRQFTVNGITRSSRMRLIDLPPAYHDEFSYLLQAQTFLAGRLAWPAMEVRPDLFHQVHVLNQPATASRYFPWTGAWIAPFAALGEPLWGHWTAGGITCVFSYLSLVQLTAPRRAFGGGLLIALSPGIGVFSSLLLAHHPTMMALSVFHWAMLRMMTRRQPVLALIAGTGLGLAMLGRPMTAAGAAFPYGLWMLTDVCRSLIRRDRPPNLIWRPVLAMALPLLAGGVVLALINHAIMGSWSRSAYQHYTETMTPRHRYGFNNVVRSQPVADETYVLKAYDQWAVNLTPQLAVQNVVRRISASVQWSLGVVPVLLGVTMALAGCLSGALDFRVKWLWWSLCGLHVAHIPYWYDGILHWHYVFESAPLLLMLTAIGLGLAAETLVPLAGTGASRVWVTALCGLVLLPGWIDADELWGPSKVSLAAGEQAYSRIRMEQFRQLTRSSRVRCPALILVDELAADPQLSYIINPPDLADDVLVCRRPSRDSVLSELHAAFPDRTMYLFDPGSFQLTELVQNRHPGEREAQGIGIDH